MNNYNITNVNHLTINDPGPNEGIEWLGGNGWKIYESPDNLTTNGAGNLQFVTGSTRRMTIQSDGDVDVEGTNFYAKNTTFDNGTSTTVNVACDNGGNAHIIAGGAGQGTGIVEVRQSTTYGGGIEYNGDGSPATTGAGADYIALFQRRSGTLYWTARNYVNDYNWEFRGELTVPNKIIHTGDTNTYMQFHAGDQWRVVVGGTERLEVKNSSPHVLVTGDLNSTSDARLKENVEPIANALSDITQLEGVSFDWKDTGTRGHGFIAQQVEPILPDVVQTDDETGIKSINYVGMIGHLVEAIKELKAEIEELKRQ